jgi:hypothetical protein
MALKVLPDKFSREPDRLIRSEREGQLLVFRYPNIATHDLKESVKVVPHPEYVDGETLAERKAWQTSGEGSLNVCLQIAEALDARTGRGSSQRHQAG